jgi:hypothetical protein
LVAFLAQLESYVGDVPKLARPGKFKGTLKRYFYLDHGRH